MRLNPNNIKSKRLVKERSRDDEETLLEAG